MLKYAKNKTAVNKHTLIDVLHDFYSLCKNSKDLRNRFFDTFLIRADSVKPELLDKNELKDILIQAKKENRIQRFTQENPGTSFLIFLGILGTIFGIYKKLNHFTKVPNSH